MEDKKIYKSQIKKFEKGKQTAPVDQKRFFKARSERVAKTASGSLKAYQAKIREMATKSKGYLKERKELN